MTAWTNEELDRIGTTQELEVASLRADGTRRQPVTIWVIREGDDLYVRSWRGESGAWYRGVQERHQGHIRAGGVDKDVNFFAVDDEELNQRIDAAYRSKLSASADLEPGSAVYVMMVSPGSADSSRRL
jgi:hypothetical protein